MGGTHHHLGRMGRARRSAIARRRRHSRWRVRQRKEKIEWLARGQWLRARQPGAEAEGNMGWLRLKTDSEALDVRRRWCLPVGCRRPGSFSFRRTRVSLSPSLCPIRPVRGALDLSRVFRPAAPCGRSPDWVVAPSGANTRASTVLKSPRVPKFAGGPAHASAAMRLRPASAPSTPTTPIAHRPSD